MELRLRLILTVAILLFIFVMINFIKKDNISIKYSLVWLISSLISIIVILVPNFLEFVSQLLGFELASNMTFMIAIGVLFTISFSFTIIVSRQTQRIRLLIQEVSMLKARVEVLEKNEKK